MSEEKITNLELSSLQQPGRMVDKLGLTDTVIKLRAEHSLRNTVEILNRDHPKPNGARWHKHDIVYFMKRYRERAKTIASSNTSVCDEVSKTVINTANGINKLNTMLNDWLDNMNTQRTVMCPECLNPVEVFDTDKAVRVCGEIRRTLVTAHNMTGSLPNVEQTSETVGKAVEFTQMLDKMVADGTIIIVSKDKPISEQVAKALGETPSKPKEPVKHIPIREIERDE